MPIDERSIQKIAVLGAGVMGAQLAALFANSGYPVLLFDRAIPEALPNALAQKAINNLTKITPAPLMHPSIATLITPLCFDNHLDQLKECHFIIEAISENIEWKLTLWKQVAPYVSPQAIIATNTSGLSVTTLAHVLEGTLPQRFCGVHFFNPPRYMGLVELIPTLSTDEATLNVLESWLTRSLGKRVIRAKDTPNFIANRVGIMGVLLTLKAAEDHQLSVDVVDDLTGERIGRPKSATYRTADVVGLDTMSHVIETMSQNLLDPVHQKLCVVPQALQERIAQGALGAKVGQGFYKKQEHTILYWHNELKQWVPSTTKASDAVQALLKKPWSERLGLLRASPHPEAQFLWAIHRDLFHYCALFLQDFSPSARELDEAMRWGYGWRVGPFELWQLAGWLEVAQWIEEDRQAGKTVLTEPLPTWVQQVGPEGVHRPQGSWSANLQNWFARSTLPVYAEHSYPVRLLGEVAAGQNIGKTYFENNVLRISTLDEQVALVSLKTKMRTFNLEVLATLQEQLPSIERDFMAVVFGAQNDPFSAGGDLQSFLVQWQSAGVQGIRAEQKSFQDVMLMIRYLSIPSVAAVRGFALGGGCELLLHCSARVVHQEAKIGLVEAGMGILPGAGGLTALARSLGQAAELQGELWNWSAQLTPWFQRLMRAEIALSAKEAQLAGWLSQHDIIVAHEDRLLSVALAQARFLMSTDYRPPVCRAFPVAGIEGLTHLRVGLLNFRQGGYLSDHDVMVGTLMATVLCGGEVSANTYRTESSLLDLERCYFGELIGTPLTQARIMSFLKTGKPLRN